GAEVSRETLVGGHLSETAREFTKGLGPARRRVGHHGHVHTLVAEILGYSNARVDGRLAGGDGHVGRVGDEGGALHDGLPAALDFNRELREILEHFGHFVAALTAPGTRQPCNTYFSFGFRAAYPT